MKMKLDVKKLAVHKPEFKPPQRNLVSHMDKIKNSKRGVKAKEVSDTEYIGGPESAE